LKVGKRKYSGDLYTVSAGKHSSDCTYQHRWLVKFTPSIKDKYCLYLMVREGSSRVGVTKVFHNNTFAVGIRARQEGADSAWILDVFDTKKQALIAEQICAARWGITDLLFKSSQDRVSTVSDFQQDLLDSVHIGLGDTLDRVKRCLSSYGRHFEYPLWSREKSDDRGVGNYLGVNKCFVVQACNIINGFMRVRSFDGGGHSGDWHEVSLSKKSVVDEWVYSLSIEPTEDGYRLYIANNLVTHNSIYSFRGAHTEAMDVLATEFSADELPLSICYRCPKKVIKLAQEVVPHISCPETAEEGHVRRFVGYNGSIFKGGDLVVCRNNAPIVSLAFSLLAQEVRVQIRGRDIGRGLIKIIEDRKADSLADLDEKLKEWQDKQIEKFNKKDDQQKIDGLMDKMNVIAIFRRAPHVQTVHHLISKIESMFKDTLDSNTVTLSTVHKAKGLEFDRVFVLNRNLFEFKSKKKRRESDLQQEKNIRYVAFTRAKKELLFIELDDFDKVLQEVPYDI